MKLICRVQSIEFTDRTGVNLGEIFELPDGRARELISFGYAEPLSDGSIEKC